VRVAIAGSHSVGKTALISRFLGLCPECVHEPEAFETLADDVELTESGAPTRDGLLLLLNYTLAVVEGRAAQDRVIFERSPVDYLAYAAASVGAWHPDDIRDFLRAQRPRVRDSLRHLELIAYLPIPASDSVRRRGEGKVFRRRVDAHLRRALLEDRYRIFGDRRRPVVVALAPTPGEQLRELRRRVGGIG
jgi:hypothetical protein